MAQRPGLSKRPADPAKLLQPRNRARESIISRIELGQSISNQVSQQNVNLDEAKEAETKWQRFNYEMLRRMFTAEEYAVGYRASEQGSTLLLAYREKGLNEKIADFEKDMKSQIAFLESLAERLDLIKEDNSLADLPTLAAMLPQTIALGSKRVFIVHGRDEEMKAVVARFVEKCGLDPVILHEQPDKGRTIIEKFEHASEVALAIVLLSPDDVGGLKADAGEGPALQDRARQNVIMELGFFLGALGRSKVIALKRGELELPSDYAGVIFTAYDIGEGWKFHLTREMMAAGLEIDLKAAIA